MSRAGVKKALDSRLTGFCKCARCGRITTWQSLKEEQEARRKIQEKSTGAMPMIEFVHYCEDKDVIIATMDDVEKYLQEC
ncbi:MAG: hypothetical protein RIQ54_332 [Candidatus Parcubacteria bacterium]|jgi:hypothetical protein